MANIFLSQDIHYITEQEVKDSTVKLELINLTNDEIKILIVRAENTINNYIGYTIDITTATIETIQDIKIATLYIVEQIFENGDNIATQTDSVKSESTGDRSVTYENNKDDNMVIWIPDTATLILSQYKKIFYRQVI